MSVNVFFLVGEIPQALPLLDEMTILVSVQYFGDVTCNNNSKNIIILYTCLFHHQRWWTCGPM